MSIQRLFLLFFAAFLLSAQTSCSQPVQGVEPGPGSEVEDGPGTEDGPGSEDGPGGGQEGPELISGDVTVEAGQALLDYFAGKLAGKTVASETDLVLSSENDAENAEVVWSLWKQANDAYQEEKLIDIQQLTNGATGRWQLPSEYEPSAVMPYYYGSKGSKPAAGWPLYVYLHGSGDKNSEWSGGLNFCQNLTESPSLYFIPQIPNEGAWYRWWQAAKQWAWEKLLRLAFVSGDVDPDRVYFFGISEGGYGSQRLASFYADYFAGAGPMAGGEPLRNAPAENCANIAFSLRTGEKDTAFGRCTLTQCTKDAFDRLEQEHPGWYEHFIELESGSGHGIDYYQTTPWISKYERNPYPKYFCWENFEMHGLWREGFYNIQVLERTHEGSDLRGVYEMRVSDNTVAITVRNVSYEVTAYVPEAPGVEMSYNKKYEKAVSGKFKVYLNSELVDLSREVTVTVNGKAAFNGFLERNLDNMAESCALFGDPRRIFPCAVEVDLSAF